MSVIACTVMRHLSAWLGAIVALGACHRDPPATTRPGEIVPLDPAGLARVRANESARRPSQPALRVVAWEAVVSEEVGRSLPAATIDGFAPSLIRRLEALDAWSPRAARQGFNARMTFALSRTTLTSLVREQLARPGYVEIVTQDVCPKFVNPRPLPNVRWVNVEDRYDVPLVDPNAGGVAPLVALRLAFSTFALPENLQWAHGAMRSSEGAVSRRGFCIRSSKLAAPAFSEIRSTLDPSTLAPMLEVSLTDQGTNALLLYQQQQTGPESDPLNYLLSVDNEIVGPVRLVRGDAGPAKIQVIPTSQLGSVSPELVGALWRSGPIAVPFTIEETTPPTTTGTSAPTP